MYEAEKKAGKPVHSLPVCTGIPLSLLDMRLVSLLIR